jgi:hypothetical protein
MWLANCYNYYRIIWFDTFKSSGVPNFAVEGVVVNTSKPVLKMTESIPEQKYVPQRQERLVEAPLVRYEYPERRRRSNRPETRKTWF